MTLRLTPEQDELLERLAVAEGVSKNEAAVRAIVDSAARLDKDSQVREMARAAIQKYRPLLDRLAQ
ncbi:CopG family transcriptional regulator [Arthrobacter sp. VKM Ac-2550]|uniref:CopG family transcriptional regulator n=1 Tax=Crystallibacter permensis TaxID=1938888 RepID=UPI0022268F3B|nr:CopG family transcriptional regulator [Arthrobacter sp. VKM Ac-2550]